MESLDAPESSIINIGKEFAFEGLDPNSFKGKTADEYRDFKKGYEEGIRIMKERQLVTDDNIMKQEGSGGLKK